MDITSLTVKLLNNKEQETSDKRYADSYKSFIEFIKELGALAVYFNKANNYANTANTIFLTRRLAEFANINKGKIRLIYDKNDEKLCEKIEQNLPFLNEYSYLGSGKDINEKFVLCGGEFLDGFWETLSNNSEYIMAIRPYLDGTDFSFIKIQNEKGDWITFFTDSIIVNQPFPMRNYYIDLKKIKTIPKDIKDYWVGSKLYSNLDKADKLLNAQNLSLFPISGLTTPNPASDRGDNCVLILALAALAKLKSDSSKSIALIFTDYTDTNDPHFSLLRSFCDLTKDYAKLLEDLKEKYPQASEDDLKAGLLSPLLQKRSELSDALNKLEFWDGSSTSFQTGKLYICLVGTLPYDYIAALYANSKFLFFESCDYLNLAVNVGVPFLHKAIETASAYPGFFGPADASYMGDLCDIFSNDISAYATAFNKNLSKEIDRVADFLRDPKEKFFTDLSLYAQGKSSAEAEPSVINDKLAASAGVFDMLRKEMENEPIKSVILGNDGNKISLTATPSGFKELHKKLRKEFEEKGYLNLSSALDGMRISKYFSSLAGKDFILTLDSIDDIVLDYYKIEEEEEEGKKRKRDDDEICGVSINNAKSAELTGGTFEINFTDWHGGNSFGVYINGNFPQPNSLLNLPWIKFSDVNFSVITAENNMPTKGSVGGYVGRTDDYYGVNFVIDFNYQNNLTRIMANFKQPLSAFGAFGAIAGGLDFKSLLPKELAGIVDLGLSELVFVYDKENNKITTMSFSFANSSGKPWVLWKKGDTNILTANPSISVTVDSPMDFANRQIRVAVGCFVDFGDTKIISSGGEIGQLWLGASYPPFVAEMRMASEEINVNKLLKLFDCNFDTQLKITDLSIFADFGNSNYKLSAAVSSEWVITDNFVITGLGLHIADKSGKFSIGFAGTMKICKKVDIGVAVGYDSGTWKLAAEAKLSQSVTIKDLVDTYKGNNSLLRLNNEEENPLVAGLKFVLTKKENVYFEISAFVKDWNISFLNKTVSASGAVGKNKDGFYGYLQVSMNLLGADCIVKFDYSDVTTNLFLKWGKFSGEIIKSPDKVTARLDLNNFNIGEMIETFIGWYYGSSFSLDPPWDILNTFEFNITLIYTSSQNGNEKQFEFKIGCDLDLGFGKLKDVKVIYNPNEKKKIDVQLSIAYAWAPNAPESVSWDASQPGTAPAPAGRGNKYFDLRYLAFGQKVQFFEPSFNPQNTEGAIGHLIENTTPEKFPAFDENTGMLVAANFGILKSGNDYFLDTAIVFYDPSLFALRVKLAGTAAKIFDGLAFEIIYAKLSETLGVFKATITLPSKFRQFELGAYSITLPDFYIEIYTNGDFKIDVGFPKNGDFSRSFCLSGIIVPGIPVIGFAGFYFGKLSSASAESSGIYLPESDKGMFNPAIVFGLGLRIGVGKNISYGPLSGGFSLTVVTILEGVIAKWNPYDEEPTEVWYYSLKGTAALIGEVYGKIDFAIISVSVNVKFALSVDFAYEVYKPTALTVSAYVEASASLTINLWLFKIHISFSFSIQVKETFVIGKEENAPWDPVAVNNSANALLFVYNKADSAANMNFSNLIPPQQKIILQGNLSLAMTAAADEYSKEEKCVIGNVLLTIEKKYSFEPLAETLIYWVVAAAHDEEMNKSELLNLEISECCLARIEAYFEKETMPISIRDAENFLENFFKINILETKEKEDIEGTYFPIPPSTKFQSINNGTTQYEYALKEYNKLNEGALNAFKDIFKALAIVVEEENARNKFNVGSTLSVSEYVFCDWFAIAAKHSVRTMRRKLRDLRKESIALGKIIEDLGENFYGELSGLLSRFFLHGLRLPTVKDGAALIKPKKKGLWVKELDTKLTLPEEAGIFSLTGQAFALPYSENISFEINITSRNSYFVLPKNDLSLKIDSNDKSDEAKKLVETVNALAKHAKTFTLKSDFEEVKAEFVPEVISFANPIEINKKYIWSVPDSLTEYFDGEYEAYPQFGLYLTKYDNDEIKKRDIDISPLALIEFSISKTDTKGIYVIGSASQRSIRILQKIITTNVEIETLELLKSELFTNSGNETFLEVSQINMSTETRPPDNLLSQPYNRNALILTLKLLWKAFVTNNGGYILTYRDSGNTELGDKVTLAVTLDFDVKKAGECEYMPLVNAVSSTEEPKEGEVLTAFAEEYVYELTVSSDLISPAEMAEKYCTDIRRIAEENPSVTLKPVEWNFKNIVIGSGNNAEVRSFTATPKVNEKLADFALRNSTTPAYALWLNRYKKELFAVEQEIKILVQPGSRMPAGSENTCSKINESYIIKRDTKDMLWETSVNDPEDYAKTLLQNSYSFLCYGVKDEVETSAPYSYKNTDGGIQYNITIPTDKHAGGDYESCGKLVQYRFNWLDYYGNKLVPEFYSARFVGYQDTLLGLSKWQSMSAYWEFKDKNTVLVTLNFSKDDFTDNDDIRKCALVFYTRLLSQINDRNLEIYLECSVFSNMSKVLEKENLINIINEIRKFLQSATSDINDLPFKFSLNFSFEGGTNQSELFPLDCSFVITRKEGADKGYEEVRDIISTKSKIGIPEDLRLFAKDFSKVFVDYILLKSSGASEIYVYKKASMEINIDCSEAELFLPKPISNVLIDRDNVKIKTYADGNLIDQQEAKNYRAVDLNIWLRNALKFADNIFSADIVSAAVLSGCDYNELLKEKEAIAAKLSKELSPAFKGSSGTVSGGAIELFRQRMLGSLSSFYGVKVIAVLPVAVKGLPQKAVFFGNLVAPDNNKFSYSSPKLEYDKKQMIFAVSGSDIILDDTGAVLSEADLNLTYNVSHIENNMKGIIDGFNASEWFGKINKDIANVELSKISIPLPLYDFPETPIMISQDDAATAEDGFNWRYAFTYSRSYNYPQQICNCMVKYNIGKNNLLSSGNNETFQMLAQINEVGEEIYEDLRTLADKINNSSNVYPDKETVDEFKAAFNCAEEILLPLKNISFANINSIRHFNDSNEEIKFTVTEGQYEKDKFCITIKPEIEGIEPQIENYNAKSVEDGKWIFEKNGAYLSPADGQKINKRKIIMPAKNVLQYQNAVSEIYVKQNEKLCGKNMNDVFIYTTPTTAFDSALNASRIVEDVDLALYYKEEETLSDTLVSYLETLCGNNEIAIQARGTYSNSNFNKVAPIVFPIFSQTKTIVENKEDLVKVVKGWIEAIEGLEKKFPTDNEKNKFSDGKLSFELIFFSDANKTPLLTIKNAYISNFLTLSS
ncbi:MAG: hypothetical protein LBU89_07230 [Fibromonadaceae bacterium]|jgi:hypothetical protein|nr:hypothetical protein [Fibromonadaceae bacterium]